jgi:hypothetical protein
MRGMANDTFGDMMAQWKKINDDFIATWGKSFEQFTASPEGEATAQEAQKGYLGMRSAMAEAARNAYGPVIEAVGAVPLSEFQRLADQVHTVLLRLDRIDDALEALMAQREAPVVVASAEAPEKKKAAKARKAKG